MSNVWVQYWMSVSSGYMDMPSFSRTGTLMEWSFQHRMCNLRTGAAYSRSFGFYCVNCAPSSPTATRTWICSRHLYSPGCYLVRSSALQIRDVLFCVSMFQAIRQVPRDIISVSISCPADSNSYCVVQWISLVNLLVLRMRDTSAASDSQ